MIEIAFGQFTNDLVPIVFPAYILHKQMVRKIGLIPEAIDTAGEVTINQDGTVRCTGESVSLSKKADPERDAALIAQMFGRD